MNKDQLAAWLKEQRAAITLLVNLPEDGVSAEKLIGRKITLNKGEAEEAISTFFLQQPIKHFVIIEVEHVEGPQYKVKCEPVFEDETPVH